MNEMRRLINLVEEPSTEAKVKQVVDNMLRVFLKSKDVQRAVMHSPEMYRAIVYETGVIKNPEELDGTELYHQIVDELERRFNPR